MSKHALLKLAIVALLSGTSQASLADVITLTDDATLQQQSGERYFSQSGISGEQAQPVDTAGADMTLALATQLIIPDSWVIKPSGNLEKTLVSWRGGVSWPIILRNIANDEGVFVNLDWVQKIVSIHVPGQTKSESKIAQQQQQELATERNEFRKLQRQKWQERNDRDAALDLERKQLDLVMQRQRDAQKNNDKFIEGLNKSNEKLEANITALKNTLSEEQSKRKALEEKYAVIDPSLAPEKKVDATELFDKFEDLWVKPYDDSFDYYIKGGHTDVIDSHTPATYIAKSGTIEEVLNAWADNVGWHVEYKAGVQHYNPFEVTLKGSFFEACRQLVSTFKKSDRPINIQFFPDVVVNGENGEKKYGLVRVIDHNYKAR